MCSLSHYAGLDGKGVQRVIALARHRTRHIKTLYDVLFHLFLIHSFCPLLITVFTIALIKCSAHHIFNF